MTALIDQEVRDEIRSNLDVSLCVEAGAGTGKTYSLVSRITELFATGRADADSIIVITFTEKAAAELSSRVREALATVIAKEGDAERRDRLIVARKSLYRAHIETIHAFATALLHERPVEAGLDPNFEVLSGLAKDLDFDAAYDEWLDALLESGDKDVGRALNLGLELGDIRTLAEAVDSHRFLMPLEPFPSPEAEIVKFVARVAGIVEELEGLEAQCSSGEDQALINLRNAVVFYERIAEAGESEAARERFLLHARCYPKGRSRAGNKDNWGDSECLERVRELGLQIHEMLEAFKSDLRSTAMLGILPRVEEFVAAYRDRRLRDGRPDFDDLLIWARDLLRDKPKVRSYFQDRFSHLLIDEFQDTDPIQVEIAMYLTSDGQDSKDWRELKPTPGKLFVVGDPKQSIYRFRRADIAIYDEVKRESLADGVRKIIQNFRSVAGVIDWVNSAFNALLVEEQGVQPGNEPLVATETDPPDENLDRPPVIVLHGGADDMNAEALRRAEGNAVSKLLDQAVMEEHWQVRDRQTKEWRDANWGDIAVLMPTRSGLDSYEEALGAAGIPHRHAGGRDYFRRQEVRDLIHILRAIDDPGDGFSVVGALRSSAFGCSDADLVIHRAGDGERQGGWNYRSRAQSQSPQVAAGFEVLADLSQARRGLSLAELVRRVIERSHLVEFALTLPEGPQAAANLLAIGDQAQSFSSAGGGGLRAFTRWLDKSTQTESQEVDAGITEDADEVVRLMTIHGAKGLEFPIVVLGNLSSVGRNQREPVVDEPGQQLHLRVGAEKRGHFSTPDYDDKWDNEKAAQEAEQIRLLYVGATRACDHLIVPFFKAKSVMGGSSLGRLADVLPDETGHQIEAGGAWLLDADKLGTVEAVVEAESPADAQEIESSVESRDGWQAGNEWLIARARKELKFTVASSVERSSRPMTSEASSSSAALLLSDGPPIPIGDALHLVMERVSLPDAKNLSEVAEAVCAEGGLEEYVQEITELAQRCLVSPTVVQAIRSGAYEREVPFTVLEEDGGLVTGRADLVFRDGDEYVIADYKTDSVESEDVESHAQVNHRGQAAMYLEGLGASSVPAVKAVFVFCRAGVEVTFDATSVSND
jgi:ATP-dependent helicase/nuclease subunit A